MTDVKFAVAGMSCAHCKAAVEEELNRLPGVAYSIAAPETGVVEVGYDESRVGPRRLIEAIEEAGYTVTS